MPLRRDSIRELESHLRDAVQERLKTEASAEAAWRAAVAQLGTPDVIAAEYGKLPPCAIWHWWPAKVVLAGYLLSCLGLCSLVFRIAGGPKADPLLAAHVLILTFGYVIGFAASAIAVWSVLSRAFQGWSQVETEVLRTSTRWAAAAGLGLTVIGIVLGAVWARLHWGDYWYGTLPELCALAIAAWYGFVLIMLANRRSERLGFALGLASYVVVACGWFGPIPAKQILFPASLGPHFAIGIPILVAISVVPFLVLAFLPAGQLKLRKAD